MRADTPDLTAVAHGSPPVVMRPEALRIERRARPIARSAAGFFALTGAEIAVEIDVREQDPGLQIVATGARSQDLFSVTHTTSTPRAKATRSSTGAWLVQGGGRRCRYRTKALARRAAEARGRNIERKAWTGLMLDDARPCGCGCGMWTVRLRWIEK